MLKNRPTTLVRGGLSAFLQTLLPISGDGIARLAAPENLIVTENVTDIDIAFDAVVGATDYQYNATGSWVSTGGLTSVSGIAVSGSGTVFVRAMDGAIPGYETSAPYSLDPVNSYFLLNSGNHIGLNAGGALVLN